MSAMRHTAIWLVSATCILDSQAAGQMSRGHTRAQADALGRAQEEAMLRDMAKAGADDFCKMFEERVRLDRLGISAVTNWGTYVKAFNVKILNTPVSFDVRDAAPEDMSTAMSAMRYWLHCRYTQNRSEVLQHADTRGKKLIKSFGVGWWPPEVTKITILFGAMERRATDHRVLLHFRQEHPSRPTEHTVIFGACMFRKTKDGYVYTDGLHNRWSDLVDGWQFTGAPGSHVGPYPEVYSSMTNSDYPKHFYTIEKRDVQQAESTVPLKGPQRAPSSVR